MSQVTPEILESYLADYGWGYRQVEPGYWLTGWQGQDRAFSLAVRLSDTCLSFQVLPFLWQRVDWERSPALSRFLLELNHGTQMVKLVVDDHGELGLVMDVFATSVPFTSFADALGVLGYYSDILYEQIVVAMGEHGIVLQDSGQYLT